MKHHRITYHTYPNRHFNAVDELVEIHRSPLTNYLEQLFWWNERINLVSRDVSRETVWDHIRHSLLVSRLEYYKNNRLVIDAGTGGGLPGIPLSIVSGVKQLVLNDIVTKKVLAVKQILQQLSLENAAAKNGTVAELGTSDPFLLVSKHAFKIDHLYRLTAEMPWNAMIFYKGSDFEEELESIRTPLFVSSYDLYEESGHAFYKNKSLVVVTR